MNRREAAQQPRRNRSSMISVASVACAVFVFLGGTSGCVVPLESSDWAAGLEPGTLESALADLPPEAVSAFVPLTKVFYGRITSRRFNSRATFEDPSVRQFFPTIAAYSDYYAALVDAIDRAHIENNRPKVIELLSVEAEEPGLLRLQLRFVGENDLPLRWWSASLLRADEWRWQEGRWWVVPGKV